MGISLPFGRRILPSDQAADGDSDTDQYSKQMYNNSIIQKTASAAVHTSSGVLDELRQQDQKQNDNTASVERQAADKGGVHMVTSSEIAASVFQTVLAQQITLKRTPIQKQNAVTNSIKSVIK